MEEKKSTKHRIGTIAIILFIVAALICDLIGLIPFAKDFTATIFWAISSFVLWRKGLEIFNGRKVAVMAISWVSSMIPVIQELPIELTAGIIAIIIITRAEEKTGVNVLSSMNKGVMPAPLNAGGARLPPSQAPLNANDQRLPNGGITPTKTRMVDINPPEQDELPMAA